MLPRDAAALVPEALAKLFRDAPASISSLAKRAPLASMRRWLESLTRARCELEVYRTDHFGEDARLRFHVDARWAPSFRGIPGKCTVRCPDILKEVHALTGHIDCQYGATGTLVDLGELRTLAALVDDERVMGFDELRPILARRPKLGAYLGFYEANGDWLCVGPEGKTLWVGGEWTEAPTVASPSITTMLERYFDAMTARREFHP
jgi:hypothetical protein